MEGAGIDAIDWQIWRPSRSGAERCRDARWRWLMLTIVVLVHALGLLFASSRETRRKNPVQFDDALVVSFIDRAPAQMLRQQAVDRPVRDSSVRPRSVPPPKGQAGIERQSSTSLDVGNAPLLLHIQPDTWNPDSVTFSRNALDKPVAAISSHSETSISRIQFHSSSPKQKLEMLGRLFGAIKYEPCQLARDRLANLHAGMDALDLAADLRTRERHCRP